MTTPEPSSTHDAREGSGDPVSDPAAAGERAAEVLDGDGGAVPVEEQERAQQTP